MKCVGLIVGCLLFVGISAPADAKPSAIERIQGSEVVLADGTRFMVDQATTVEKKGYDLSSTDLRPGWAVQPHLDPWESDRTQRARKVDVVALPLVQGFPDYRGLKDTIAIGRAELGFLPAVKALESVDVQQAIEEITSAVLRETKRFLVVDALSKDEMLNEQDFARSGYGNTETAARGGRIVSARYLAKVAILDFDYATRTGSGGGAFGINVAKTKARSKLTMELRLTDVETGIVMSSVRTTKSFGADAVQLRINLAETAEALTAFSGANRMNELEKLAAAGVTVAKNGFVQSPIGELFSLAINDLAEKLLTDLGERAWQSVLVEVLDEQHVVIRGGEDAGLRPGTRFEVTRRGAALSDPETGVPLGALDTHAGLIEVMEVKPKVSIARVISGNHLERGDSCLSTKVTR